MKENIKINNPNNSNNNELLERKISCLKYSSKSPTNYKKSKFIFDINKSIPKKSKSKKSSRISVSDKKKLLLDNIKEKEEFDSKNSIKNKLQNSLLFTERILKEKIEKNLSVQIEEYGLEESFQKSQNENENTFNKSPQSLNSVIKRNIQKSTQNKNLKRRRRFSNDLLIKQRIRERNRKIFQIKHVYDSLEDSEDNNNDCEDNFYISPETTFIYIFDLLIILCLSICIIYLPLKISFYKSKCVQLNILDKLFVILVDIIFIIDLIFGFYRAYYNSEFKFINDIKLIVRHYLKTYFAYDLISAFPSCSFLIYYYTNICFSYTNNNQYIFILVLCFLKLFKCVKIKKNKFIDNIYELFSKNFLSEQIFDILKMILITFSIFHLLICCHIFIGFHYYPSWIYSLKETNHMNSNSSLYITSFYFLITTLTTVGYGDIICLSFPERVFQLIELSLGVILYSYIVSKIGDYVKLESYAAMIYNNNSAILEEIRVSYPKMPFKLYNQILHHLQTNFQQQKKSDINLLINSLPHTLKYNLLFVINRNHVNNFYFFKKCYNSNFIAYTLINLVPITYKKNALIIKEEQILENSIFIVDGRLSLEIAINLDSPTESIQKYLNKNYNPLKNEGNDNKNSTSLISKKLSTIDMFENKTSEKNEIKSFLTQYSNIMKNQGIEFAKIERDFDESNYQFLNISNIFKNEQYGEVFIILNQASPLFLRVKSKKANIFLLNRKHILHLSENFPNIWKRIFNKSLKNMEALKQKTIEVVNKYSSTYNVKLSPRLQKQEKNKNKIVEENKRNSKIYKARASIKDFLSKNIKDFQEKTKIESNKNKGIKEEKSQKDKIKSDNNLNKENIKIIITKINENNEKIKLKCKTNDFNKQHKNKFIEPNNKLFKKISTKLFHPFYYSSNTFETNHNKKLLTELQNEINKRNNYLNLLNESNKKIKQLYSQLVNNSIDLSNYIGKIELDTQLYNNLDLSKILFNNINNNNFTFPSNQSNIGNKLNIHSLTMKLRNKNKINNRTSTNSFNSTKKTKTIYKKGTKKKVSIFNKKKENKAEQIFINLNQPFLIFNTSKTFDNKDEEKNETNIYNKFFTLSKKSNFSNDSILDDNFMKESNFNTKENVNQSNISSSFIKKSFSQKKILSNNSKGKNMPIEFEKLLNDKK